MTRRNQSNFLWVAALLFSTLACRAATSLVIPATPTPLPTSTLTATATLTPSPTATQTPTATLEAACSSLLAEILNTVTFVVHVPDKESIKAAIYLISYEVNNNQISGTHIESVPDGLEDEQDDRTTHEEIWDYFVSISPPEEREFITEFSIFTDGRGKHLAAVGPLFSDPEQWNLQ